jgi:hypothetical protein
VVGERIETDCKITRYAIEIPKGTKGNVTVEDGRGPFNVQVKLDNGIRCWVEPREIKSISK